MAKRTRCRKYHFACGLLGVFLSIEPCNAFGRGTRTLDYDEFLVLAAQMATNCRSRFSMAARSLSSAQIEWLCDCIASRTLKAVTVADILVEQARNRDVLTDPGTNFRRMLDAAGSLCIAEAKNRFNLN
jgi:hypothetical protein